MTDAQHLHMADVFPIDNDATPSRSGHRHKRSFAISGDFDFLKQPGSLPPMACSSPGSATANSYTHNTQHTNLNDEDALLVPETMPRSPFKVSNQVSNLSPRFFISEEPKFSSPFQGVPDAIINLDDALKAKPKSFKNHKRSESAPPDLAIFLNTKPMTNATVMIEEEEDDDDSQSNSESSSSQMQRDTILPSLMSPLRPQSPTRESNYNGPAGSPLQSRNLGNSSKLNSLKINGQKQRYHYYTKKLSINAVSNIQPQSLKEKPSTSSLVSGVFKTPLSTACTPSKQVSTPSTPVSSSTNCTEYNLYKSDGYERGPISPVRTHQSPVFNGQKTNHLDKNRSNNNNTNTTFKYETIIYDMPQEPPQTESVSIRDDKTLMKRDASLHGSRQISYCSRLDDTESNVFPYEEQKNKNPLSKEILFGEPGDVVDLSTLPSSRRNSNENVEILAKQSIPSVAQAASVINESLSATFEPSQETRSVSDSVLMMDGKGRKDKKRVKSKLNYFFSNFFKTGNESRSHDRKN